MDALRSERACEVTAHLVCIVYKMLVGVVVNWFVRIVTMLMLRVSMINFKAMRERQVGERNVVLNIRGDHQGV